MLNENETFGIDKILQLIINISISFSLKLRSIRCQNIQNPEVR